MYMYSICDIMSPGSRSFQKKNRRRIEAFNDHPYMGELDPARETEGCRQFAGDCEVKYCDPEICTLADLMATLETHQIKPTNWGIG